VILLVNLKSVGILLDQKDGSQWRALVVAWERHPSGSRDELVHYSELPRIPVAQTEGATA
jgi:ribosomal protein L30E